MQSNTELVARSPATAENLLSHAQAGRLSGPQSSGPGTLMVYDLARLARTRACA